MEPVSIGGRRKPANIGSAAMEHRPEYEPRIRELAYQLWEEAGRPDGRSDEFWRRARAQVFAEEGTHDKTLSDSFPASDPPGTTGMTSVSDANKP
jgi:hypothetical protein